jgi:diaminopimelate epimerase
MKIPFVKMHGAGNDFILMNRVDIPPELTDAILSAEVCHRHFGIGADGLMIAEKTETADARMHYYNSDGSLGEMCGNGIRCFARYILMPAVSGEIQVETLAGVKKMTVTPIDPLTSKVSVEMGIPLYHVLEEELEMPGKSLIYSYVTLGVPHVILFNGQPDAKIVETDGPAIENHPLFKNNTNVNFCHIENRRKISLMTWERGAGHTLACGTGVSSACGVAYRLGRIENQTEAVTEGGILDITIRDDGSIVMAGPAKDICTGFFHFDKY